MQMISASRVYSLKVCFVLEIIRGKSYALCIYFDCNDDVVHFKLEKIFLRIQMYRLTTVLQHREHFFPPHFGTFIQCSL